MSQSQTALEGARDALASKLRQAEREAAAPASAAPPAPHAPGPKDPFEGAVDPVVERRPALGEQLPCKRILTEEDVHRFEGTQVFGEILGMIRICNEQIKGKKLTDPVDVSEPVAAVLGVLDQVQALVRDTPRDTDSASKSRFGNPAFRTLYSKIVDATDRLEQRIPGLAARDGDDDAYQARLRQELAVYFYESWGNAKRIDYGSGMELNFLCWLLCLVKLGILVLPQDAPAIVLRVFWRYVEIMRMIQSEYWLEPAGSHGVWGLDDYHFLPFLWGAAQLSTHAFLRPKSIHEREIVEECAPQYMYFACIHFINAVKTASLRWHSPMLDDISGVRTWSKVNEGMVKMYRAEVLLKLPIAQHIFFGSLLPFGAPDAPVDADALEDEHGHRFHSAHGAPHAHGHGEGQAAGWGDCCGIPIPSAFAAAEQAERGAVRRIPFD